MLGGVLLFTVYLLTAGRSYSFVLYSFSSFTVLQQLAVSPSFSQGRNHAPLPQAPQDHPKSRHITSCEGQAGKEGQQGQAGEPERATLCKGLCSRGEDRFGASESGNEEN